MLKEQEKSPSKKSLYEILLMKKQIRIHFSKNNKTNRQMFSTLIIKIL